MNLNAQLLASLIRANCEQFLAEQIDRRAWDFEQRRLWKAARVAECERDVLRLVMPTLAGGAK